MSILLLFCILFTIITVSVAQTPNYCNRSLCPSGSKHIACGNNGAFAPRCPANANVVKIKPHIRSILALHNSRRNLIAGGGLPRYEQASRMATMQWDKNLAALATLNAKQCVMEHDSCRNTPRFKNSGQNLYSIFYTGKKNRLRNARLIKNAITSWFKENKVANMNYINKYPENYSGPDIGHFTVFVADRNNRVGCAIVRYGTSSNNFLLACNYATTNIIGTTMYVSGKAASGCKTGINPNYTNLCSTAEVYTGL